MLIYKIHKTLSIPFTCNLKSKVNKSLLCFLGAALTLVTVAPRVGAEQAESRNGPLNIIVFVADGWGFNQLEAASIYQFGDRDAHLYNSLPLRLANATYSYHGGYDPDQAWESFDYFKRRATDSASSATAISTGERTLDGRIGVNPEGEPLSHTAKRAHQLGMSTGVVSSVQLSHATPASFIAHNESRGNYAQIGAQMIEESTLDVIMGAGHPLYTNNAESTENHDYQFVGGQEVWERIVAGEAGGDRPWTFVESVEDFRELMNGDTPERVLGIPRVRSTLQYNRSGNGSADPFEVPFNEGVPNLKEMMLGALNILSKNPEGFFLHVEGGAIDWAGHGNNSPRLIEEHLDFDKAVAAALAWVEENSSWQETLVVITGDHETGYLNGPGSGESDFPMWTPIKNRGKGNLPGMEWHSGGHTNQLIPFYAKGKGAARFHHHVIDIDKRRGPYIHHVSIAKVIAGLLEEIKK